MKSSAPSLKLKIIDSVSRREAIIFGGAAGEISMQMLKSNSEYETIHVQLELSTESSSSPIRGKLLR